MKVDVAVIGAGPGGGMAACRLSQTGLNVVVLEKNSLPRHKPCGGGMPSLVSEILDWDFSEQIENRVPALKHQYNFGQTKIVPIDAAPILMVSRRRFDLYLIERAVALGRGSVQLREGFHVAQVEEDARGVSITSERGERIDAEYVIAADGAFSKTARCLGLNRKAHLGAALDAEVEVVPEVYEAEQEFATFNFFCVPNGYGWIFPKAGYLSCGVGSWRGKSRLPAALDEFLQKSFPRGSIRSVATSGHPIPLYSGSREIASPRVCLVGDAASLVDPVLGEGIRFALKSGALAADVIGHLLGTDSHSEPGEGAPRDCRAYEQIIHQTVGREFGNLYRFVSPIFFRAPEFFYRKFILEDQSYIKLAGQLAGYSSGAKSHRTEATHGLD